MSEVDIREYFYIFILEETKIGLNLVFVSLPRLSYPYSYFLWLAFGTNFNLYISDKECFFFHFSL